MFNNLFGAFLGLFILKINTYLCLNSIGMEKVKNPCKLICKYDQNSVCMGCCRSREEVTKWPDYSEKEKLDVFEKMIKRGGNPYQKKRYTF